MTRKGKGNNSKEGTPLTGNGNISDSLGAGRGAASQEGQDKHGFSKWREPGSETGWWCADGC